MTDEIKSNVFGIFPTPIYISNIDRNFSKEELAFVDVQKEATAKHGTIFNYSINQYVLNEPEFADLKKEVKLRLHDYFDKVISPHPECNVTPYLTQSWLTFLKEGENHHPHSHSNSFISGVLYIDVDETKDNLAFLSGETKFFNIPTKAQNQFDSKEIVVNVKTGQLMLFPSQLVHYVKPKRHNKNRICLSFNSFIKGTLGIYENSTELKLT